MNQDRMNEAPSNTEAPVKDAVPVAAEEGPVKPTGWLKWFWIAVAVLSAVYIVIPEPTDAFLFPIPVGLLDEATAAFILTYALERLGIRIPFLSRMLGRKKQKKD
ncbi:MAG: hypothetical protein F9K24_19830 [Leptonema illini]|jgi:hypothetical protein|uniref:Uncharacterized protein n=1 Tax=Leptonema illini TaxID=183 RepID=A0A833LZI4_9LEPT|nr:MAG: hypothetical protein F9K24_19830 [Leptonema illini]PKL30217.1 MAG: hypothetical protein CVV45_18645 [Spirochaetae bacterium HGW-Spirochaetae-10]